MIGTARGSILSGFGCLILGLAGFFSLSSCQTALSGVTLTPLTGVVSLGRVDGGLVCAYALTAAGARGTLLGCASTDSSGNFSIPISSQTTPVEVFTTGGSYVEEGSGSTVQVGISQIRARIPDTSSLTVPITALTEIAAGCVDAQSPSTMSVLAKAVTQCNSNVAEAAGLSSILTLPADPTKTVTSATAQASLYGLVLAGISEAAQDNGLANSLVMTQALESDFAADGIFDGTNNGTPITFPGTSTTMPANVWTSGVVTGMTEFAQGTTGAANGFGKITPPSIIATGTPGKCPSGQTLCGSTCFDLQTSQANCGTCGDTCSLAHATSACTSGSCTISSCSSGYGNCDGNATNGCETNLNTSLSNCGSCGNVCSPANATPGCVAGSCTIVSCSAGFKDCDENPNNGCETAIENNPNNCGSCGNVCPSGANSTAVCSLAVCGLICNPGFGDCDGNPSNGCETSLESNPNNCGTCGNACVSGHLCLSGVCQ